MNSTVYRMCNTSVVRVLLYEARRSLYNFILKIFRFVSGVEKSNSYSWAISELRRTNLDDSGNIDSLGTDALLLFSVLCYLSGTSYSTIATVSILAKLAKFEPLSPLTGEPDEWLEVSDGVFQNVRYFGMFKDLSINAGKAYLLDGKVFRTPSGCTYTSRDSRVYVDFPYTVAPPIVVDVPD